MKPLLRTAQSRNGWLDRWISCLCAAACLFAGAGTSAYGGLENRTPTQTLELREWFGVNHSEQIVEFALDRPGLPGAGIVLDDTDSPVPFQLLGQGRKLAICTDLRANSTRIWRWFAGIPSQIAPTPQVRVKRIDREWEIGNELIAVRIPTDEWIKSEAEVPGKSRLEPIIDLSNYGRDALRIYAPAPIQGVRLRDGTWSALGPNTLVVLARRLTDAKVELLEPGPLKAVVRIHYDFDKPAYSYGQQKISDPGPGYLTVTITAFAG